MKHRLITLLKNRLEVKTKTNEKETGQHPKQWPTFYGIR